MEVKALTVLVCCNYCVFVLFSTSLDKTDDNMMCVLCIGSITQWYTRNGSVWSPFLQGGMKYNNGNIIVPQRGLYYVYAQLYYYHSSSSYRYAGFFIKVNGNIRAGAHRYTQDSGDYHTHYTGRIISLKKGDHLSLYFASSCYYYFTLSKSFFGAFKL